ncbi:hypothetical protein [Flavobacterium sp. M31R6]|uniref:hypothetical protein n=1 Tax=Flavobacterium sp. M31R6 TaxID=2739062 RepID=UPI00156987F1|nr:hypothetical protein [Flavobacterium sp. M31R6]QKJ64978.1 hypothetical protein HQN62_18180 [Flavobacterium sp. M31R6]
MKKLLFLFGIFLLFSCSNSDDNTNSSNSDFHPPAWIQGVWEQQSSLPGVAGVTFSFSTNDFCFTNSGIAKQCQQDYVNQMRQPGNSVTVTETTTETTYTAEIKYYAGQSVIYSFRKLANNKIEWTAVSGSVFIKQ